MNIFGMIRKISRLAVVIGFSAVALWAQSAPPSGNTPSSPPQGRPEPCWKQAGITLSMMEQHQQIEHDAHSQIASACEDSSLTPQQKQEQVKQIREQSEEKTKALIPAEQLNALHACQQQRHGGNMQHHPGAGPCGNFEARQRRQGNANGNENGNPQPPQN
ncbi:MAG TPA: hypothetical protein VGG14_03890 [Candidatus Sulfotelmatobacter sp.]|jgi:hypothetical protein